MSASLTLVVLAAVLFGAGVYVMLERSLTRVLIGFLLAGNAVNILMFVMAGAPGLAPILGDGVDPASISDPLPQAFILTAIVINLGITAFMLALIYRSWWLAQLGAKGDQIGDEADLDEDMSEHADLQRSSHEDDEAIQRIIEESDEEPDDEFAHLDLDEPDGFTRPNPPDDPATGRPGSRYAASGYSTDDDEGSRA
ncbi:sodium:proton antiporter [Agromyces seonyuensis]|uniref:Na(+)/H(+) antiporter subunit C n=1 Tax=Agromyces seonyuensis TaxID=2662446 RepID=A0A6I4P1K0_9MICO|nr:NADH-quinone oxidoreductase subunit K [Agromyces seonyuensis]MWB98615.1 Na(+)/H(+) antiporter subunit C [Agromyces seonyuensis]